MKKVEIGSPMFQETYFKKEYSDDKPTKFIYADVLFNLCEKLNETLLLKKNYKSIMNMFKNFDKQINDLDPGFMAEKKLNEIIF